jgi:hypothetical protein
MSTKEDSIRKTMSSLTERKKKEIETQYREMVAKRARKVFLTVFCNVRHLQDTLAIPQVIMDSIRKLKGIESVSYTNGTNVITVIAQWEDYKVNYNIRQIKRIPNVMKVTVEILSPLF